jgi:hypothetical protein
MDKPVPLEGAACASSFLPSQLREVRAAAFSPAESPAGSAAARAVVAAADDEGACAAAWDAAFAGPLQSSPAALISGVAQLRACAADVCDVMLAGAGGGGGADGDSAERAIDALRGAVERLAAQLAVQRQQEALARVCLQAEGLEPGGVASAQACLARLRAATAAVGSP